MKRELSLIEREIREEWKRGDGDVQKVRLVILVVSSSKMACSR